MAKRTLRNAMRIDCVAYRNKKLNRGGAHMEFVQLMKAKSAFWVDKFLDEMIENMATSVWEEQARTKGPGLLVLNGDKEPLDEYMTRKEITPEGDIEYRKVSTIHGVVSDLEKDAEVKTDNIEDAIRRRDKRLKQHKRALKLAGGDSTKPLKDISTITK